MQGFQKLFQVEISARMAVLAESEKLKAESWRVLPSEFVP